MRRGPPGKNAGFTLIEMLVVLVILGLVAGLIVGRGRAPSQRLEVDSVARQVAGALRTARSYAIARGRPIVVTIGAHGYQVEGEVPHPLAMNMTLAGPPAVVFEPDGSSSGGRVKVYAGERWMVGS